MTDETYNLLKSLKLTDESFGDLIKRLCEEKIITNLLLWLKENELWKDMDSEEIRSVDESLTNIKHTPQEEAKLRGK